MNGQHELSFLKSGMPFVLADYDLHWQPLPDRFRFLQLLGRGGMGEVWLAEDLRLPRHVAIKTVRRDRLGPAAVESLKDEARKLAELCSDRRVAQRVTRVFDLYEDREHCFIIAEFIDGCSLRERLRSFGPLHWLEVARYLAEVADVLAIIHTTGIIHRDIKPENLLWSYRDDQIVMTDFGIAARDSSPQRGGTIGYLSPEVMTGMPGKPADSFALGVTGWHLITGSNPFEAATLNESIAKIYVGIPLQERAAVHGPLPLVELLIRMMSAFPTQRPTMSELVVLLRQAVVQSLAALLPSPADHEPLDLNVMIDGAARLTIDVPGETETSHIVCEAGLGKAVKIRFSSSTGGYLALISVGTSGTVDIHKLDRQEVVVPLKPGGHRDVSFLIKPPAGTERVIGMLSTEKFGHEDAAQLMHVIRQTAFAAPVQPANRDLELISPDHAAQARGWRLASVQIIHQ